VPGADGLAHAVEQSRRPRVGWVGLYADALHVTGSIGVSFPCGVDDGAIVALSLSRVKLSRESTNPTPATSTGESVACRPEEADGTSLALHAGVQVGERLPRFGDIAGRSGTSPLEARRGTEVDPVDQDAREHLVTREQLREGEANRGNPWPYIRQVPRSRIRRFPSRAAWLSESERPGSGLRMSSNATTSVPCGPYRPPKRATLPSHPSRRAHARARPHMTRARGPRSSRVQAHLR